MKIFAFLAFIFSANIVYADAAAPAEDNAPSDNASSVQQLEVKANADLQDAKNVLTRFLSRLSGTEPSDYQKKLDIVKASSTPFNIALYDPTYILPAYYTGNPDQQVYADNTPDGQSVDNMEFKAQLSFMFPIVRDLWHGISLDASYTQLSYWQFYAKSQYFRETDYMPALFISDNFLENWQYNLGVEHQSNGRGGDLERSWNRLFGDVIFSRGNWMVDVEPWVMIFKGESSDLHNPDIRHYMGNGEVVVAYKAGDNVFSVMSRNNLQSGFRRGAEEITWSHPFFSRFSIYVDGFSGFGQSLIEYNHYTNSIGIGLALNSYL